MRCSEVREALPKTMTTYASQEQINMILRRTAYAEDMIGRYRGKSEHTYWAGEFCSCVSILGILGVSYICREGNENVFLEVKHGWR
jgi:hypothetical protein